MQLGVLEYLISVNDKGVQTGIDHSEATIKKSAAKSEKGLKDYGNKISAWTIAKGQMIANATTKIVRSFASTTKQLVKGSVMAFADYEQLVGGVETLFKGAAVQVQKFAQQAYKTAGISANEYMETVTSFSASLLQSLENDTDKAADYADMAIKDMADNANKMGSSMESIQNAYQGFAKQNYTMLDNLKLGYGGTKTEMERLLSDAGKLVNRKFDISKLSDVYEAIHVIQQEMGIFGTTQKEAEGTISGSINMMKASWKDLLVSLGSGKNIREVSKNLTNSVKLVLKNITPIATNAFKNIFAAAKEILPDLKKGMKEVWEGLKESFKDNPILSKLTDKIDGIAGFFSMMSDLLTDFDQTTDNLINSPDPLLRGFGKIAMLADQLIGDINEGIEESDSLLLGLLQGTGKFVTNVIDEFTAWINKGGATKIADGIVSVVSSLASMATELVTPLAEVLGKIITNPSVWSAIESVIDAVGSAIFNLFVELAANLAEVFGFDGSGLRSLKISPKSAQDDGSGTSGGKYAGTDQSPAINAGELTLKNGHKIPINISAPQSNAPGVGSWVAGLAAAARFGGAKGAAGYVVGAPLITGIANAIKEKTDPNSNTNKMKKYSAIYEKDESPFIRRLKTAFGIYDTRTREEKGRQYTNKKATGQDGVDMEASVQAYIEKAREIMGKTKNHVNFYVSPLLSANALSYLQSQLNSPTFTVKVQPVLGTIKDTNPAGTKETSYTMYNPTLNAKGNWAVPYDNFPALLHRDEMVLTKSQARQFRDGAGEGTNVSQAIADAVTAAMSKVYVMMSGEKVGDLTTRRVRKNMNASSYSKLRALGG